MYFLKKESLPDLAEDVFCVCEKTQIANDVPHIEKTTIGLRLNRNLLERDIGDEVPKGETLEGFTRRVFKHHFERHENGSDLTVEETPNLSDAYKDACNMQEPEDDNNLTIILTSSTLPAIKALSKLHLNGKEAHVTDITKKKPTLEDESTPDIKCYKSKVKYDDEPETQDRINLFHPEDIPFNQSIIHGTISRDRPIQIDPDGNHIFFHYSLAAFYQNPANKDIDFKTASKGLVEYEIKQILEEAHGKTGVPKPIEGSHMVSHGYSLEIVPTREEHEVRVHMDCYSATVFKQAIESFGLEKEHKTALMQQREQENGDDMKHLGF